MNKLSLQGLKSVKTVIALLLTLLATQVDAQVFRNFATGVTNPGITGTIGGNTCYGVAVTNTGKVWVRTSSGADVFNGTSWTNYTPTTQPKLGVGATYSRTIAADNINGLVWMGSNSGGVASYNESTNTWTAYTNATTGGIVPSGGNVKSVFVDATGKKWMSCTTSGSISFDGVNWANTTPPGATNNGYSCVDPSGRQWVLSSASPYVWINTSGTWASYTSSLLTIAPNSLVFDASGKAWIAELTSGLVSFDGTTWDKFTSTSVNPGVTGNIAGSICYGVTIDANGVIWCATNAGVCSFNGTQWTTYNTTSGLPSNTVYSVTADGNTIWAATSIGVSQITFPTTPLTTLPLSTTTLCAGGTVNVPYYINGTYGTGNIFTAQLSDATGSFTNATPIGTATSTASGTISATIPPGVNTGSGYRIRVIANNPSTIGIDNGTDLTINASVIPSVIIAATPGNKVCEGTSVTFNATVANGGTTPTYAWKVGANTVSTAASYASSTFIDGNAVSLTVTSNATCAIPASVTSNTIPMTIYPKPTVSIAGGGVTICAGTSVQLTASGNTNTYSWSAGTTPATGDIVRVAPATTTSYTVSTTDANNCTNTATTTITINTNMATANVTPAAPIVCNGKGVQLTSGGTNNTIFSEEFNTTLSSSWTNYYSGNNQAGAQFQKVNSPYSDGTTTTTTPDGSSLYVVSGTNGGNSYKTALLTSPVFSTVGYSSATLTYYDYYDYASGKDANVGLDISTDNGANWIKLNTPPFPGYGGTRPMTLQTINLNAYVNKSTVQVRFHYESSYGYYWAVDKLLITGVPSAAIWAPTTNLYNDAALTSAYTGNAVSSVYAAPPANTTYTAAISGSCAIPTPVNVTVADVSAIVSTIGNSPFCQGDSAVLTVKKVAGATYQWRKDAADIASATDTFFAAKANGAYKVVVTNSGCKDSSIVKNIVADAKPVITFANTGVPSFCQGDSTILTVKKGTGYTYQWRKDGADVAYTDTFYSAKTTGIYRVVVKNGACTDSSAAANITMSLPPVLNLSTNGNTNFCQGDSLVLKVQKAPGYTYQWKKDGGNISTATDSSYAAKTAGSYKVIVKIGSCTDSSIATAVTVKAGATKPVLNVNGTVSICAGDSTVMNTTAAANHTYDWYYGSQSMGITTTRYAAKSGGVYKIVATNISGCKDSSLTVTVNINPLPNTSINNAGPTTFCSGKNVLLNAAIGYANYQWKKDGSNISSAIADNYTATASGSYKVVVKNTFGCTDSSGTIVVTVNTVNDARITALSDTAFCEGDSVMLTTNKTAGYTYDWYNGPLRLMVTDTFYLAKQYGNYTVVAKAPNGCIDTSAVSVVIVNALPTPKILANGDTLSTGTYATYQWHLDGQLIPNATNQTYTADKKGNYTVEVSDPNGCANMSSPFPFNPKPDETGAGSINTLQATIKVFPNPATNIINIAASQNVKVTLRGMDGKSIMTVENAKAINISHLADGVYILHVLSTDGQLLKVEKMVKNSW